MIYFLIPVYNEEANIPNLHREMSGLHLNDQVYFVFADDGSSDNSKSTIAKYFDETRHVVLGDGVNRGPGAAFNTGFKWILSQSLADDDVVVTMEADCTSDISILDTMLVLNKLGYDLVLASVYAQGGGFDQTSFIRKFISAAANFLYRFLFDIKVLTLSSFYRVYKASLIKKINQTYQGEIIGESGFVSMLEILTKAIWCNAKVIEVPMQLHSSRRIGKSKMKILKTTIAYFRYLIKWKSR
ncbi:MAG TPA: glycosyltransferase [Chryseosolibacter sp.]